MSFGDFHFICVVSSIDMFMVLVFSSDIFQDNKVVLSLRGERGQTRQYIANPKQPRKVAVLSIGALKRHHVTRCM